MLKLELNGFFAKGLILSKNRNSLRIYQLFKTALQIFFLKDFFYCNNFKNCRICHEI